MIFIISGRQAVVQAEAGYVFNFIWMIIPQTEKYLFVFYTLFKFIIILFKVKSNI